MNLSTVFFRAWVLLVVLGFSAGLSAQITIRAAAQGGAASGNLVLPKPAGTLTNDVLVAAITVVPASATVNTPAGWVSRSDGTAGSSRLVVFTRVVPAADASVSSYTFTFGGASHVGAAGGIVGFIGVDTTNPLDITGAQSTAAGFSHAAPSISTTVRGTQLVAIFGMAGATEDWSPPAGMVEVVDVASVVARPQSAGVALLMALESRSASGATGVRTALADNSGIVAAQARTALLALRPALTPASTHYRLDGAVNSLTGAAGEVFDSGGTGLHGFLRTITAPTTTNLLSPSPTIHSQHSSVTDQFCNAAQFDGRAVLQVPANPLFDYTTEFSASAWIFPTARPSSGGLFSVLSNDQNYEFHINSAGRLNWWWGGGARELTSDSVIPNNRWTHVAITFRSVSGSARQRIYINGVLDRNTNSWAGTLTPNGCDFYIGGDVATGAACTLLSDRAFRGMIDEVRLYNFELSAADVARDMRIGRPCVSPVTRFRIEHDGTALSCAAESVTIRACANADCSAFSTTGATGTLTAGANSVPFNIPVGQSSVTVPIIVPTTTGPPDPELVRLGIGSVSPTPALIPSCRNGAGTVDTAGACDISTADAGFAISVPDHVSDTTVQASISAVRRSSPGGACVPLFANVTRNVGLWAQYVDPATGTRTLTAAGTTLSSTSPGTPLPLAFNAAGVAVLPLRYPDVGRLRLDARYVGSAGTEDAGLVVTGDTQFIVRPARFLLSLAAPHDAAATATDATRAPFVAAGVPFSATVTAQNASGAATPNFGRESTPERVRFESVLLAPSGGINPTPAIVSGFTTFTNGSSSGSLRWDEVGVIRLRPRLQAAPYLDFTDNGTPLVTGDVVGDDTGPVGRFRAARLAVAANVPTLRAVCPGVATGLTYLGQEFGYDQRPLLTVTGLNALGSVTRNYVQVAGGGAPGAFWRLGGAMSGRQFINTAVTTAVLQRSTDGGAAQVQAQTSAAVDGGFDGQGRIEVTPDGDRFTYLRPATPIAPFSPAFDLRFPAADLTDADGACFDPGVDGVCDPLLIPVTTPSGLPQQQRWGRLVLDNAFGPDLIDLRVPMRAEFFNGSAFVLNTDDVCSAITPLVLVDPAPADTLLPGETCVQDSGTPGASGLGCAAAGPVARRYAAAPAAGIWNLWLRAPGAGNVGVLDLTPSVPPWLQFNWRGSGVEPPTARVGFGVFQGDPRAIHTREVY